MTKFCPLISGSSGNSVFIGTDNTRILIDAGVSGKKIENSLKDISENCSDIDAIFVTHEHIDHIKAVGIISRRFDIPVYATEDTWKYMFKTIGDIKRKNIKLVYSGEKMCLNDIIIKPFDIPHDAAQPVGYNVFADNIKMSVATDIGHVNDTIKEALSDSNVLLIEANHDIDMLKRGPYPYDTKQRILGMYGHMANECTGELIKEVFSGSMKHIFLGHMSAENNTPDLAYSTVLNILTKSGINVGKDVNMFIAKRDEPSNTVVL